MSNANLALDKAFDDSALVAIGICLEEILTASMLPLASLHVRRCRGLEQTAATTSDGNPVRGNNSDNHVTNPITGESVETTPNVTSEDVFHAWTLPPEESLIKVFQKSKFGPRTLQGMLPTSKPPTRSIAPVNKALG